MDYKKIYNSIIEKRKLNELPKDVYGEKHHILPKCLGGNDEKDNLIRLTAKEHFICHLLLSEMFPKESFEWYKTNHAFQMMCSSTSKHSRYINGRIYELKKNDFSKTMSWSQSGEKNSQYGKLKSEYTKEKIKNSINKRLGKSNNISYLERKKLNRQEEFLNYTYEGVFYGKQRRNIILKIFKIDLTLDFKNKIKNLKDLLIKIYCVDMNSTTEIGIKLNADSETIRNYLKLFKIPLRTLSESIKNSNQIRVKSYGGTTVSKTVT
jgi:hypothetical protein